AASKSSLVLESLKKGQALEAKDRKGMFWEVVLPSGQAGFVSVMEVTQKLSQANSPLSMALREAVQKERQDDDPANMRSRSAVMGVRGLAESSEAAFAGNVKHNLRMVYQMEHVLVKKDQINELGKLIEQEIAERMHK